MKNHILTYGPLGPHLDIMEKRSPMTSLMSKYSYRIKKNIMAAIPRIFEWLCLKHRNTRYKNEASKESRTQLPKYLKSK